MIRSTHSTWDAYALAIGHELNRRRHEVGLSQERLAHAAGVTRYHYQQLEKGESKPGTPANPSLKTLTALAQALGTDVAHLLPKGPPDLTEGH